MTMSSHPMRYALAAAGLLASLCFARPAAAQGAHNRAVIIAVPAQFPVIPGLTETAAGSRPSAMIVRSPTVTGEPDMIIMRVTSASPELLAEAMRLLREQRRAEPVVDQGTGFLIPDMAHAKHPLPAAPAAVMRRIEELRASPVTTIRIAGPSHWIQLGDLDP